MSLNIKMLRFFAALKTGEAAGNLYKSGRTPHDTGEARDFGAFQWAEACGFGDCPQERSMFTQGFTSTCK